MNIRSNSASGVRQNVVGALLVIAMAAVALVVGPSASAQDSPAASTRVLDPAITAETLAQKAVWDSFGLQNYSFSLRYICFCPVNDTRILVTNGVPEVIETPFSQEFGAVPQTIDALFADVIDAVNNPNDTETISFDGTYGYPTNWISQIDDPNVADGFYGFEITAFSNLDGVANDFADGAAKWAQQRPYAYSFNFSRTCFCPPPFEPVVVTVVDNMVTSIVGTDIGEFEFSVGTIDELIADGPPSGSFGGTVSVEIDPAWGFPTRTDTNVGVLGIADGFYGETITDLVPLNIDRCNGLLPTMVGTAGDDILTGTEGVDVIMGLGGDDQIYGLGGDDHLCGGAGNDLIGGGDGNDYVAGDDGDDNLNGHSGNDTLEGGFGNDRIRGQAGNDRTVGGPGTDNINGSRDNDSVYGESGDDFLRGGTGDDTVHGGDGVDFVSGNGGADLVFGGAGDDELRGGPRPDMLYGGTGNDLLKGFKGADMLDGGNGDDDLRGNEQPDSFNGANGTDICNGGPEVEVAVPLNCETIINVP